MAYTWLERSCVIQFTKKTGLPARCAVSTSIQSPRTKCFTKWITINLRDKLSNNYTVRLRSTLFIKLISVFFNFPMQRYLCFAICHVHWAGCLQPPQQHTSYDRVEAGIGAIWFINTNIAPNHVLCVATAVNDRPGNGTARRGCWV